MSFRVHVLVGLTIVALAGCGGDVDPSKVKGGVTPSPHNGATVALPDGEGFAEFLDEETKQVRGKTVSAALVVYFLNDDKTAPLATLPTDVSVSIGVGDSPQVIALSPAPGPKPSEPFSGCRFASPVGKYSFNMARGELSGTLNGKPFTIKFNNGR